MQIGRFEPDTARWVVDRLKWLLSQQSYSQGEVLAAMTASANQRAIHVRNTDTEDAPGYACMQVVGIANPPSEQVDRTYLEVQQPSDQYGRDGWYVFNGPEIIAADDYGVAYAGPHAKVSGYAGSFGERCLPIPFDWAVTRDPTGWMHFAGSDDTPTATDTDLIRVFCSPITSIVAVFETPVGGIPAISGGTLGKATCDLYELSVDGSGNATYSAATDEDSTQITHTVRNMSSETVFGSIKIQATLIDGLWIANWEDCV